MPAKTEPIDRVHAYPTDKKPNRPGMWVAVLGGLVILAVVIAALSIEM